MVLRRITAVAIAAAMLGLLSACAGSVAAPDAVVTSMPTATKASLRLVAINGEVASGVTMTPTDINRVLDEVKA
jgi:hypothetical protein